MCEIIHFLVINRYVDISGLCLSDWAIVIIITKQNGKYTLWQKILKEI